MRTLTRALDKSQPPADHDVQFRWHNLPVGMFTKAFYIIINDHHCLMIPSALISLIFNIINDHHCLMIPSALTSLVFNIITNDHHHHCLMIPSALTRLVFNKQHHQWSSRMIPSALKQAGYLKQIYWFPSSLPPPPPLSTIAKGCWLKHKAEHTHI